MDDRRTVARWALGIGVLLTLIAARPALVEYAGRSGSVDRKPAVVEGIDLDWGDSLEGRWHSQEVTFRIPGEGTVTKPGGWETVDDLDEGDPATLGFAHGELVSVNGVYVRPFPLLLIVVLPVVAGAFVLAATHGRSRRPPGHPAPYTAGYVTQGVLLCFVFGLLVHPPWWPAAAVALGVGVPLAIYAVRFRRGSPAAPRPQ